MSKRGDDGISQRTEDAIVNTIMSRLAEKSGASGRSLYRESMDSMDESSRRKVQDALDRHAARQRAAGKPGW